MSSNETEMEAHGIVPKSVHQISKVWIDEEVSQMWEVVETAGGIASQQIGNTHLQHIFVASGSSSGSFNFRSVIHQLPCNFYSNLWWKGLTEAQQSCVKCNMVPKPIPSKLCSIVMLDAFLFAEKFTRMPSNYLFEDEQPILSPLAAHSQAH